MAKISGPLMSMDASGKLAGAIVFSKWKGRNYVRSLVTPANPKLPKQVAVRAMFKFLAQDWKLQVDATDKATWVARADQNIVSPFNAYMSANQKRWRNFDTPSKMDPPTGITANPSTNNEKATGGVRQALLQFDITDANDAWGFIWFRSVTPGFTASWTNAIHVGHANSIDTFDYVDSPLIAGTYYWRVHTFDARGFRVQVGAQVTAVVT